MQIRINILAAAATALLVACGGGEDNGTPPPSVGTPPPSAGTPSDMTVTGTGSATPILAGRQATATFIVTNLGPGAATNVSVAVATDANQTLGTIQCAAQAGATCPTSLVTPMTVPSWPAGGKLTFTVSSNVLGTATGAVGVTLAATAAADPMTTNNSATATSTAVAPNSIKLQSDSGDYIGRGRTWEYSRKVASIGVTPTGNRLAVSVLGDENWSGDFVLPSALTSLTAGTYNNLTRYSFHNASVGGLNWSGDGRGCNTLSGSITISNATYVSGVLQALDLSFEQHCEGSAAALRGQIHWTVYDDTSLPGPVNPPPAGLWVPAAGATPASGNYVYLLSEAGDYIGAGGTYLYQPGTDAVSITLNGGRLQVNVGGWGADFVAMNAVTQLQPGYYGGLERYPFHNPVKGGLDWSGNGRGCNQLSGWFAVDSIAYVGTTLKSIDLRFEQHCEVLMPALRGKIHWVSP